MGKGFPGRGWVAGCRPAFFSRKFVLLADTGHGLHDWHHLQVLTVHWGGMYWCGEGGHWALMPLPPPQHAQHQSCHHRHDHHCYRVHFCHHLLLPDQGEGALPTPPYSYTQTYTWSHAQRHTDTHTKTHANITYIRYTNYRHHLHMCMHTQTYPHTTHTDPPTPSHTSHTHS